MLLILCMICFAYRGKVYMVDIRAINAAGVGVTTELEAPLLLLILILVLILTLAFVLLPCLYY